MKNWKNYFNILTKSIPSSPTDIFIFPLRAYQILFSPDHGIFRGLFGYSRCRFYPTCSVYAITALRQYGLLKGGVVSLRRVLRCGPWNPGGYDPVDEIPNHKFQITNKF